MDSDSASNARTLAGSPAKEGGSPLPEDAADAALRDAAQRDLLHLYGENFSGLYRYAHALTRNRERSQDAVQEAFLRYYASRVTGSYIQNGKAWLYTVLRNYVMDRYRESRAYSEVGIEMARDLADETQNVEHRLERSEIPRRVLQSLSPREQECLRLRAEGLRYREIGDVLGIAGGTVCSLLVRAVKKLRSSIDRERRSR